MNTNCKSFFDSHNHMYDGKVYKFSITMVVAIAINLLIPLVQTIGGIYAGSMAIVSDALHNFSDVVVLVVAYAAIVMARKSATTTYTFGYKRAEVVAAFFNAIVVIGASVVIFKEALERLMTLHPVRGEWVVVIALVGVLGNGFSAWLLHSESKENIHIQSAFLHLLGDFLTSLAVLAGGVILLFKSWYWIDPLLSIFVVIFIWKNCWGIFSKTLNILMEATPRHIDLEKIKNSLESIPGVEGAHYLHAWTVHPKSVAFSCHVVVEDQLLSNLGEIKEKIQQMLLRQFHINHPVLQFETVPCGDGGILCDLSCHLHEIDCSNKDNLLKDEVILNAHKHYKYGGFTFLFLRFFFGGLFVYASLDKILHPKAFAEVLFNYKLLPDVLINVTAIFLPWLEFFVGAAIVAGRAIGGGLTIANGLLLTFTGALLLNIYRGIDISCGCFSTEIKEVSRFDMWLEVLRDLFLLLLGVVLFLRYRRIEGTKSNTGVAR